MKGILTEAYFEFIDRKQHWLFLAITAVAGVIIYFAVTEKQKLVQNEMSSQASLLQSASYSLGNFVTVIVLLAVISSIFLFPRLLRLGRIEFYLTKPITRAELFSSKIISHWAIYGITILFCSSIIAAELSALGALPLGSSAYVLVTGLAVFLVWFSVVSFTGFLTKSVSISFATLTVLWVGQLLLKHRTEWGIEQWSVRYVIDFFYYILPKTSEMSALSVELATGGAYLNYLPILTSLALAGFLIYTANSLFCRRDF